MEMGLGYVLKNYGNSPALQEADTVQYYIARNTIKPPTENGDSLCKYLEWSNDIDIEKKANAGNVIFPQSQMAETGVPGIWPQVPQHITTIPRFWAFVCVVYRDQFGWHHSKYWFRSNQVDTSEMTLAVPGFPLKYSPFTGFNLWQAEAD
jgi:hypothetical protein